MIKLIAIDLDGTLLTNEKNISPRTVDTLKKAKQQGVKVVLCTGRPLVSVHHHLQTLGLTDKGDYSVTFNGGVIRKNDTGEVIDQTVMGVEDVHAIYKVTSSLGLPLDVVSDQQVFTVLPQPKGHSSIYHQLNTVSRFEDKTIQDFKEAQCYNKMVCSGESDFLESKVKEIPSDYYETYNIIRSGRQLFEFVPKLVSKGRGLTILGKELGIDSSEMMALGDEENDLSMLEYVGFGVAMKNGSNVVKDVAQYITDTNENDGVAKAVEKFVLRTE